MRTRPTPRTALLAALALSTAACEWSRFDDLKDNVPVVQIESPGGMPGFATTMATVDHQDATRLLVLGEANLVPKGVVYDITSDNPPTSPAASGFCPTGRCLFGDSPAPLAGLSLGGATHSACFLLGVGDRNNTQGLVGSCADGTDFVLPVPVEDARFPEIKTPEDVINEDLTAFQLGNLLIADFRYAASDGVQPLIAASSKHLGAVWYYPPGSSEPVSIAPVFPPDDDPNPQPPDDPRNLYGNTFGAEVAVAKIASGGHLIAVASPKGLEPDVESAIWLYRVIDGKIVHDQTEPDVPKPVGCLPGFVSNFGTFMHVGQLLGDESDELFVSDGETISIYDVGALMDAPPPPNCGGPALGAAGFVTTVECLETNSVKGCSFVKGGFGRSITLADVDGDGRNELVVGAPTLSVEGTSSAGAVLVYEVDPQDGQTRLLEARFISSRDTGDALGASVAGLRIGGRDVIAAGASGLGSFFLFYCSTAGGAGKDSSRCQ